MNILDKLLVISGLKWVNEGGNSWSDRPIDEMEMIDLSGENLICEVDQTFFEPKYRAVSLSSGAVNGGLTNAGQPLVCGSSFDHRDSYADWPVFKTRCFIFGQEKTFAYANYTRLDGSSSIMVNNKVRIIILINTSR